MEKRKETVAEAIVRGIQVTMCPTGWAGGATLCAGTHPTGTPYAGVQAIVTPGVYRHLPKRRGDE